MKREELERMIEAAQDYNQPPETPRDEMWAAIRAERPWARATDELAARRAVLRRRAPWAVALAAAATLAVGFGLGRLTQDAPAPVAERRAQAPLPIRVATAEHLGDAEALLTLFRASDRSVDRTATTAWARELLSTTRLLLDSRVADDPEMAALLSDLELVLVQMANAGGTEDHDLIEQGIEQQQLLFKLRTVAAPVDISL